MDYIEALESAFGRKAKKNFMDIQTGDVPYTHADVKALENYIHFKPKTSIEMGIQKFVNWYKNEYL